MNDNKRFSELTKYSYLIQEYCSRFTFSFLCKPTKDLNSPLSIVFGKDTLLSNIY